MPLLLAASRRTARAQPLCACATWVRTQNPPRADPAAPRRRIRHGRAIRGAPGVTLTRNRPAGHGGRPSGRRNWDSTVREARAKAPRWHEARANTPKAQAQLAATEGAARPQIEHRRLQRRR